MQNEIALTQRPEKQLEQPTMYDKRLPPYRHLAVAVAIKWPAPLVTFADYFKTPP